MRVISSISFLINKSVGNSIISLYHKKCSLTYTYIVVSNVIKHHTVCHCHVASIPDFPLLPYESFCELFEDPKGASFLSTSVRVTLLGFHCISSAIISTARFCSGSILLPSSTCFGAVCPVSPISPNTRLC